MPRVDVLRLCVAGIAIDVQVHESELSRALRLSWAPFATAFAHERLRAEVRFDSSLRPGAANAHVPYPVAEPRDGGGWTLDACGFRAHFSQDFAGATVWQAPDDRVAAEVVIRRMLAQRLIGEGGALVHAVGVELEGRAALFVGVGKSTLAALVARAGGRILGDELVAVRPDGERIFAHGTPWHVGTPHPAPVAILGALAHAAGHRFEPAPAPLVARTFLENTVLARPEQRAIALTNLERWLPAVRCAELHFAKDTGVAAELGVALSRAPR